MPDKLKEIYIFYCFGLLISSEMICLVDFCAIYILVKKTITLYVCITGKKKTFIIAC